MKLNSQSHEAKLKEIVKALPYEHEISQEEIKHLVKKYRRDLDLEVKF